MTRREAWQAFFDSLDDVELVAWDAWLCDHEPPRWPWWPRDPLERPASGDEWYVRARALRYEVIYRSPPGWRMLRYDGCWRLLRTHRGGAHAGGEPLELCSLRLLWPADWACYLDRVRGWEAARCA